MKNSKYIILFLFIIFISLAFSKSIFEGYTGDWSSKDDLSKYLEDTPQQSRGSDQTKTELEIIDDKINELKSDPDYTTDTIEVLTKQIEELKEELKDCDINNPQNCDENKQQKLNTLEKQIVIKREIMNYQNKKEFNIKAQQGESTLFGGDVHLVNPNKIRYKSSYFIPVYEDSVFLSSLSDLSHSKPIYDSPSKLAGFCHFDKQHPEKIEKNCISLDKNVCASTSCCILLGGTKCVSGGPSGPHMKSHYNDTNLLQKDHYYHQGRCYGNCKGVLPTFNYK